MTTGTAVIILFFIVWGIAKIISPSEEKMRLNREKKIRDGFINEARVRKNWTCIHCNRTIYSGEIAYHFGDYPYRGRDSKRSYVCIDCVLKIQEDSA